MWYVAINIVRADTDPTSNEMTRVLVAVWCTLLLSVGYVSGGTDGRTKRPLTKGISHYEPLYYDVHKRSASYDVLTLTLHAFGRDFPMELRPSTAVFAPGVKLRVGGGEAKEHTPATFYQGKIIGDASSRVSGHLINGVFDGRIETNGEEFQVEQSNKFFREQQDFHSVMYRASDVDFEQLEASCATKGKLLEEMKRIQSTAIPAKPVSKQNRANTPSLRDFFGGIRARRASTINGARFCQVRVAVDNLFFRIIGNSNVDTTMAEVSVIFSRVQEIFAAADFDSDGNSDGITPLIADIDIITTSSPNYPMFRDDKVISVNDYLDRWSSIDHSAVCLALLLTYRDFDSGVLGLAWVAEASGGNRGGICEESIILSGERRSLNTAIVTLLNYGQRQARSVTEITIAHEFGHNFGSPHDPSSTGVTCSPGGSGGNFIMYPRATDGSLSNNALFSACSRNSINPVLMTKSNCFTNSGTFCGNGVTEAGEQCDCGDMCDSDPCCAVNCTLTSGSSCSRFQSCCTQSCTIVTSGTQCSDANECAQASSCNGINGTCPTAIPIDGTCNGGTQLCVNGACSGSICLANSLADCECTAADQLCHVCCVFQEQCLSTFSLPPGIITAGEFRESGRPCNDFEGYCDQSDPPECVSVNNDDTLDDLLDIFTLGTLNRIVAWLSVYWYIPLAVLIGIVILIVLLHFTYRKRKPIKKTMSRASNSIRRRTSSSGGVSSAQTGGVGQGAGAPPSDRRRQRGPRQISHREAVTRLRRFFPTCESGIIMDVMRQCPNEARAVKQLLSQGYPLRRIPIPQA